MNLLDALLPGYAAIARGRDGLAVWDLLSTAGALYLYWPFGLALHVLVVAIRVSGQAAKAE